MQWWPIQRELTAHERWLIGHVGGGVIADYDVFCSVCGNRAPVVVGHNRLRETIVCQICGSFNRQRQIAHVLSGGINAVQFSNETDLAIYNMESYGVLHNAMSRARNYICSEYLGPDHASGEVIDGRMHEDIQATSFADESFDVVISSDVFEHVPRPYVGFQEVHRILKIGGRHIFTVPFDGDGVMDCILAVPIANSGIEFHAPPLYHEDFLRPEGVLVYTIFGLQMMVKLYEIGFETKVHWLYEPDEGIVGADAIVFESIKRG